MKTWWRRLLGLVLVFGLVAGNVAGGGPLSAGHGLYLAEETEPPIGG